MEHRVADLRTLRLIQKWLKCGSDGGRPMVGTGDGYATGFGEFTVTRERVPALQFRSLGKRLAPEVGARRGRGRQICR
jgi:hypothetical protein